MTAVQRRAATLVVAALTVLLALVGAISPAVARAQGRGGVAAEVQGPGTVGSATQGRTGAERPGRLARAGRGQATPARVRGVDVPRETRAAAGHGHLPVAPATGAADPTGPPAARSRLVHHACPPVLGRSTPIGAGRSPPGTCGP